MRKLLCLALPALIAAACGSDGGSKPTDASTEVGKTDVPRADAAPPNADAPIYLDTIVAVEVGIDAPPSPDVPPAIDQLPATDQAPQPDLPPAIDIHPGTVDSAEQDTAQVIDGSAQDTGTLDSNTFTSPDGRVFSIVASCQLDLATASSACPGTFQEATQRAHNADAYTAGTGAGQCAEGTPVYVPYAGTTSMYCFYSSGNKALIGAVDYNDTYSQCGQSDTVSGTQIHGTKPSCTSISWLPR